MECPNCRTTDVMRVATMWERDVRIGYGASASIQARRLGPPRRPKVGGWGFAGMWVVAYVLPAMFIFPFLSPDQRPPTAGLLFLLAFAAALGLTFMINRQRGEQHAKALRAWSLLWNCGRCGHVGPESSFDRQPLPVTLHVETSTKALAAGAQ